MREHVERVPEDETPDGVRNHMENQAALDGPHPAKLPVQCSCMSDSADIRWSRGPTKS